ncbi:MAG: CpsD/CapB family tyrosine-protein kinase [Ktedonobacteraceae bacterium]
MSMPSQEQFELLTDYDTSSAYSEAYRTIYANIRFNLDSAREQPHTLLLTTVSASSPRSVFAANVAIVSAQSGIPTILVDADLPRPSLEQRFGLDKSTGLRDILQADVLTPQIIQQHVRNTFINNLLLLSAGSDTASEGSLFSTRLPEVIASLRQYLAETKEGKAGLIIFHTSPVLTGPDASLVGAQVEQTILAIVKGRTTRTQAKQAQEQLQRAHVHLAGIVILDV